MGYSPWGRKESDGTEITEHARTHILLHVKAAYALVPVVQKGLQREQRAHLRRPRLSPLWVGVNGKKGAEDDGWNRFSLFASTLWLGSPLF